jgi:DNA-binding FadR family transcriptional regulator
LRDNIYRGDIKPSERFPTENELADIMKVSRVTIRKAITQLIEMGYVENRPGQGTFVKLPEIGDSHNPFAYVMTPGKSSLDELLEVRIGLEGHGVSIAAERATDEDIAFLEVSFSELSKGQPSPETVEADIKFHMGIAYATYNSVHIDLMRRFYDYMFYSISKLHSILYEKKRNLKNIEKQHFKILEALRCRETDNARTHMIEHIGFLRRFLKEESAEML